MLLSTDEQTLYLIAASGLFFVSINTTDGSVLHSIDNTAFAFYSIDISDTYILATGLLNTVILDISTFTVLKTWPIEGMNALIMPDGGFLIVAHDATPMGLLKFDISGTTLWKRDFNFVPDYTTMGPDSTKVAVSNTFVFWMSKGNFPTNDQLVFGAVDFSGATMFSFSDTQAFGLDQYLNIVVT